MLNNVSRYLCPYNFISCHAAAAAVAATDHNLYAVVTLWYKMKYQYQVEHVNANEFYQHLDHKGTVSKFSSCKLLFQ